MGRLIDATTFADLEARRFTLRGSATRRDTKASRKDTKMQQGSELPGLGQAPSNQSANRSMVTRGQEPKLTSIPSLHFVTIEQFVYHAAYYTNIILRRLTRPRTVLFFRVIS